MKVTLRVISVVPGERGEQGGDSGGFLRPVLMPKCIYHGLCFCDMLETHYISLILTRILEGR